MKTMTKEQLAELLNGNEYRDEMTKEQEQAAKQNNLLVLFGASDDLLEMRGAIRDEVGAYDGGEYALALDGELYADGEEENTYHKATRFFPFRTSATTTTIPASFEPSGVPTTNRL